MPRYQGVDVDHPKIVEYTTNLLKAGGKTREEIARIVGMPREVVERIERDLKRDRR